MTAHIFCTKLQGIRYSTVVLSNSKTKVSNSHQHDPFPWIHGQVPKRYWEQPQHHRHFFDWLAKKLGYKQLEDWYSVRLVNFEEYGGMGLLREYHHNSYHKALQAVYTQHNWLPWRFKCIPKGFWEKLYNQRRFFDWLAKQLNVKQNADWYNVTVEDIRKHGGGELLRVVYKNSPWKALQTVYPEYTFVRSLFKKGGVDGLMQQAAETGLWNKLTHREFFDKLGSQLGCQKTEDWYSVALENVYKHGGEWMLRKWYSNSLYLALQTVYPEQLWMAWRFGAVPDGYWENRKHHRQYFDWLSTHMRYTQLDDWYSITAEEIHKHGGAGLLYLYYNDSPSKALQAVYPEHEWMPWRFGQTPRGYLDSLPNDLKEQKKLVEWLGKQLKIQQLDEWYRVSVDQLKRFIGGIYSMSDLMDLLQAVYPDQQWDPEKVFKMEGPPKVAQRMVAVTMRELFPTKGGCLWKVSYQVQLCMKITNIQT